jgi:glycosyltransferase involved in cell wall biosynthesis
MKKSISVIIPFFNSASCIGRMLDSILSSTYMPYEILLIDDGSTDNSQQVIEEYSSKCNIIKYIKKEHSGVSASRNLGIQIATGEFINFLDSDDYIEPNMYELMAASISDDSFDGCICGYFTHKDDIVTSYYSKNLDILYSEDILKYMFTDENIRGFLVTRLFKTDILKNYSLDEDISICEDLLFQSKLFSQKRLKFAYVKAPLYHYIQNTGSATVSRPLFKNGVFIYAPAYDRIRQCVNRDYVDESYSSIIDYSMYTRLLAYRSGDKSALLQIRQLQALLRTIPMKKKDFHSIAYRFAPLLYSLKLPKS